MPTYEFDLPNGKKARAEGQTPEEAWRNYNFANPARAAAGSDPANPAEHGRRLGDPVDMLKGVMQGWLDPIEGLAQLAEKSTGWKLAPKELRDWARDYRNRVQSTPMGQIGEFAGNIVNPTSFIPGAGAARAIPMMVRAGVGAAGGAAQPVSGDQDYWRTKANQALLGAVTGASLPAVAAAARRAGQVPTHFSIFHPFTSGVLNTGLGAVAATGRQLGRVSPGAAGLAVGEVEGQTGGTLGASSAAAAEADDNGGDDDTPRVRPGPLRVTVHPRPGYYSEDR